MKEVEVSNICDMLAENARLYPGEIALVELKPSKGFRREISWQEFDRRSNKIANALLGRGIRKGDRVLHWMINSIEWLVVYFGIIKTGAWVVPLNFRFTPRDFRYCAEISEARMIVMGGEFVDKVQSVRAQLSTVQDCIVAGSDSPEVEGMESLDEVVAESSDSPVSIKLNSEDECGLYFTSGTTGQPKPILLTHGNMVCAAITEQAHHYQTREDNFVLLPPLYHTGAKMHWFGSLMVGGKATILTEINPRNIFETVDRERGTIVWLLVPWVHDILVALDSGELKKEDYDLSCWRLMHIGAQPVPPKLVQRWKEYFPNMQYDTNYGLSEATGPGCVHLGIENERKVGSIGKAGYNWQVRIVDDKGRDVVPGQVGELIVKGGGVMKGYYKNSEKTAETVRNGWLYTGDLARIDGEGFIYLVDRKKDVIITGGENIYPAEVEEILHGHPKIYDVAIVGVPDERLGEIAVAVIEPKPRQELTEAEVQEFCEQNLARHLRPRRIIFDKVPRNPTGKIEKPRLREKLCKFLI